MTSVFSPFHVFLRISSVLRTSRFIRSRHTSLVTRHASFTLLEILVVIAIIAILMVLVAPAFTNLKSGNDVTTAGTTIKGVLDAARTYAQANNTYTWVGVFEEDGATSSSAAGIGRVVMSTVASKDGTIIYNPNSSGTNN